MSTKETVMEIRVPLPEGRVQEAQAIIAADTFETSLRESAAAAFGEAGYTMTSRTVTRVPGRGRKANGADPASEPTRQTRRGRPPSNHPAPETPAE